MNRVKFYSILLLYLMSVGTVLAINVIDNKSFISSLNENITYVGRISKSNIECVKFTYPGVYMYFSFEGTSLSMKAKPNSGYFMVEIDDLQPYKISFPSTDSVQTIIECLPNGIHKAKITYAIEGYEFKPEIYGFYLDSGCSLGKINRSISRRIEFIGNSITCGYGIEAYDKNEPFSYSTENHYYTYAATTARMLDADHLVVAKSGIGIYRNYSGSRNGSDDCMLNIYDYVNYADSTEIWNYSMFIPDVVCINLGTNDTSVGSYDIKLLGMAFEKFVLKIRDRYPESKIVLLTGAMLNGTALSDVKNTLDSLCEKMNSDGDKNIYRFDFSPQTGDLGYGADFHPSMIQHQKMALELTAFLKNIMNW